MKKMMANILATTGLSIVILAGVAVCYHARFLCVETVFQVFAANLAVHSVLWFLHRMELRTPGLEAVTELVLTVGLMLACGGLFGWFASTPVPVLVLTGIVIYGISVFLNLVYMKKEADEINELIERMGQ